MKTKILGLFATVGVVCVFMTLGAANSAHAANLVVNGEFETGDLTGWTQSGDTSFTGVDDFNPNSGNYAFYAGPVFSLGFLSQALTTAVGQAYQFSYFLSNDDSSSDNYFETSLNGTTLFSQVMPEMPYTQYSFNFVGTGSDTIAFGFYNPPSFFDLDDVEVEAVPTPALLPGLIGLGVAAWRKRKGEAEV